MILYCPGSLIDPLEGASTAHQGETLLYEVEGFEGSSQSVI